MWQSEDDIVKDLASLNDFGIPGDQEPYQFLYSIGRGSKIKRKKISEKFIDSRTGEVINVKDLDVPDILFKSKGRGTLLGSFLKSKLQLQQQLRLARPLGSGDEAVESYYRRNRPAAKPKTQTSPTDSEPDSVNHSIASQNPKAVTSTIETRLRVKAIRNSTLQRNVLITNLLSKVDPNSNAELVNDKRNSDTNVGFSIDDNIDRFNKFRKQKNFVNGCDSQDLFTASKQNEEKDFLGKICDSCDQNTKKKNVEVECFEVIYDGGKKEKKEQERERMSKKNKGEACFEDDTKKKEVQDKRYRKLGRTLNGLDQINSKVDGKMIFNFNKFSQCLTSLESKSENQFGIFDNSVSKPFHYSEYEFPPLRRN